MTGNPREAVRRLLETENTATLATSGAEGPWAAAVFFASDGQLNLYFVSDQHTRHGRDLAACPKAAIAVYPACRVWTEVRGLQLTGRVEMLEGARRSRALELYLAKFEEVRALFERPRDADEEAIASRLQAATLYRLRPDWIRLIDNDRGFGYKEEIILR